MRRDAERTGPGAEVVCEQCDGKKEARGFEEAYIWVCSRCDIEESWEDRETEDVPFITFHSW